MAARSGGGGESGPANLPLLGGATVPSVLLIFRPSILTRPAASGSRRYPFFGLSAICRLAGGRAVHRRFCSYAIARDQIFLRSAKPESSRWSKQHFSGSASWATP